MTKYATIETIDPQAVIKTLAEKLPTGEVMDEAKKAGKRTIAEVRKVSKEGSKAIRRWRKGLPNDSVRVALPIAAVLAVVGVTASVILIRRRF